MKIEVELPYYAKGRAKEAKGGMAHLTAVARIPYDVKEVAITEAPVVIRYRDGNETVVVRSVKDRLCVRPRQRHPDGAPDRERLVKACKLERQREFFSTNVNAAVHYETDPRMTIRDADSRQDVIDRANVTIAGMAFLSDELWVETTEPVYRIETRADVVRIVVGESSESPEQCFRLDEADLLKPYVESHYPGAWETMTMPEVEVLDASALRSTPQLDAMRKVGGIMASFMKDGLALRPMDEMILFARVRDMSKGLSDPHGEKDVGETLRALLPRMQALCDVGFGKRVRDATDAWDLHVSRDLSIDMENESEADALVAFGM